jgi:hypothetical protein
MVELLNGFRVSGPMPHAIFTGRDIVKKKEVTILTILIILIISPPATLNRSWGRQA